MKVCLIVPTLLPIPAVMGGAVESLMTNLIYKNEEKGKMKLCVITRYNKEAKKLANKLRRTDFVFLKECKIKQKLYEGIIITWMRNVYKRIHHTDKVSDLLALDYEEMKIWRAVKRKQPDYIVVEGGDIEKYKLYTEYFGREKMCLHLHSEFLTWPRIDEIYGKIITVSEFAKSRYMTLSDRDESTVKVVKNCANDDDFLFQINKAERDLIRQELGFGENNIVVIFCGRIIPEKGVKELLDAVLHIKDDRIRLIIIGSVNFKMNEESGYYNKVREIVENNSERIKYLGYIDNSLLYKYYQCADIQVVPSIWQEVAGIVTIEGMYSGLPLIVTNSGGMVEYVDNHCAIKVELNENLVTSLENAIIWMMNNEKEREKMSIAAKERAKSFTKEVYYDSFYTCLRG